MDKIKEWFRSSANAIILIVFGIAAVVIYSLNAALSKARYRAGKAESDAQLNDTIAKKIQAEKEANDAEQEYIRVRNSYLSTPPDGDGPGAA